MIAFWQKPMEDQLASGRPLLATYEDLMKVPHHLVATWLVDGAWTSSSVNVAARVAAAGSRGRRL